jgi:iron-sulfur cluster repair protein YtfE (RIC family)
VNTEQVSAQLALQVVVTIVQFHHPRSHELGRAVAASVEALGGARDLPEWKRLITSWEVLARELNHHMQEEEELVLDRVQFLWARARLGFGSLAGTKRSFDELMREHDKLGVLRKRIEDELANTVQLHTLCDESAAVRNAIKQYLSAWHDHDAFERHALIPTLAPFLE